MNRLATVSILSLASLFLMPLAATAETQGATKLLRFPDLHGNQVVFTYAGDLWLASDQGGTARRLTSHAGVELFPKFSPDGHHVAFTGQYEGDEQVYVVPTAGGEPRQLTFYPALGPLPPRWGYDHQVMGWSADGASVLFRSFRDTWDIGEGRLHLVPMQGGLPTALPMVSSGAGALSPDGRQVVFSPLGRDFRHWKRYEGGWAQNLYVFDLEAGTARRITDHPRTERDPMWIGDRIFFSSDRSGKLELYSADPNGGDLRRLTHNETWDVRWPSADHAGRRIVYELAGELHVLELATETSRKLDVVVPTDALPRRPVRKDVSDDIQGLALAPEGQRAVIVARGELFSVPKEHGPTRNLTRTSGVYEQSPAWSPDGGYLAYVSDQTGEQEIWLREDAGRGEARQLTRDSQGRISGLSWSPDSRWIAYRDATATLFVVAAATGEVSEVADDRSKFGLEYSWSPDSRHLALTLADGNDQTSLHLWDRETGELRRVTSDLWNEYSPTFGSDGDYLYFVSDRMFQPQIGSLEWNYVVDRETFVYAMALRDDVAHPFPPRSDEVEASTQDADATDSEKDGNDEKGDEEPKQNEDSESDGDAVEIHYQGLSERVVRVPMEADNYFGIVAAQGKLLAFRGGAFYYGRGSDVAPEIVAFDLEKRESSSLASGISGADLSPDGTKLLVRQGPKMTVWDISSGKEEATLSTSGLVTTVVPEEEWAQMFDDAWRYFRDFFYVPNLHGYDWPALREQYEPLLAHVGHRSDLNYLISEMIAELSVSHAYVVGGDIPLPDRPRGALLGARFEAGDDDRLRIARIFRGDNAEDNYRSPLTEVGVDVSEGDYLLAIDGEELTADDNPWRILRYADRAFVELTVNDRPTLEGSRDVVVRGIRSEDDLIYLEWIEANRKRVEEASNGRAGYIHIPDMGGSGIREWIKWYYGQRYKEGLVIDVRNNGGGNVSPMIIDRLRDDIRMIDWERHRDGAEPIPTSARLGHLVALLDEDTASDGDQFAWQFRDYELGPLIGKRSWGGVVGIYGSYDLIDGGGVSVPESGSGGRDGQWIIEGWGVEPDIEIDNDPAGLVQGIDAQLEKAIEVLMETIERDPRTLPRRPAPPIKTP
ncbi:MAG: S41 family peptidase [Thermoanaerobaculia bacterium]|nr:S41 family peptidase [Thermoanaerobaculia bacterium]